MKSERNMLRMCASHVTILAAPTAPTDSLRKDLSVVKAAVTCRFAVGTDKAKVAVSIQAVPVSWS